MKRSFPKFNEIGYYGCDKFKSVVYNRIMYEHIYERVKCYG